MPFTDFIRTATFASLLSLAVITAPANAASDATSENQTAQETAEAAIEENTAKHTENKRKKIIEEAVTAIRETENAIKALDNGKPDEALASLERASGKLEILLAREPELALAPVSVHPVIHGIIADVDKIRDIRNKAVELLQNGRVQDARHLLSDLASETVITVYNLPLTTYPAAIKTAAGLIDDGDMNDAKWTLQTALNTLIVQENVIPMPLVTAQEFLKKSQELAENPDRSAEESKQLSLLLESARKQVKLAEALGYGTEADHEKFFEQLKNIEQKTKGGKHGTGFFTKIREALTSMFEDSQRKPTDDGTEM